MTNNSIIQVDYRKLRDIQNQFAEQARIARKNTQIIDDQNTILQRGEWVSDAASQHYPDMRLLLEGMKRSGVALDHTVQTIEQIAIIFLKSEDEACAILIAAMQMDGRTFGFTITLFPGVTVRFEADLQKLQNTFNDVKDWYNQNVAPLFDTKGTEGFRTGGALLGLVGLPFEKVNKESLGRVFEVMGNWYQNGGSVEDLTDAIAEVVTEIGLEEALPEGAGKLVGRVLFVSDIVQLAGALTHDGSLIVRNLLTGGDTTSPVYNEMTRALNEFSGVLDDADVGETVGNFAKTAVDIYVDPLFNRGGDFVRDPSAQNFGRFMESAMARTTGFMAPAVMASEQLENPAQLRETMTHLGETIGGVGDLVTGVPRLATELMAMQNTTMYGITYTIQDKLFDILGVPQQQQDALLLNTQTAYNASQTGLRILTFNPLGEANRLVDFTDAVPGFVNFLLGTP